MEESSVVQLRSPSSTETVELRFATAPPYWLRLTFTDGRMLDVMEKDFDLLDCLTHLREQLESEGMLICCQGARRNVWSYEAPCRASGGRAAFQHRGQRVTEDDVVDIFAPADCDQVGTIEEREDEWIAWFESHSEDLQSPELPPTHPLWVSVGERQLSTQRREKGSEAASVVQLRSPSSTETVELRFATAPPYWLRLTFTDGRIIAITDKDDLLSCLRKLREQLEMQGKQICCQGARPNVWPSTMMYQWYGGRLAYQHKDRQEPTQQDVVDIFDPADCDEVVTLVEQDVERQRLLEMRQ